MKSILFALITTLAAVSGAAIAAAPAQGGGMRAACKADVQKFCQGTQRGGGRIGACLEQNHDKLSANCQDALAAAHAKHASGSSTAPKDAPAATAAPKN